MTAAVFLVFPDRLVRGTTGQVFLIVDRLRAHLTPEVRVWVAARADRIEVFVLPRYAPARNPVEYRNHDLKGRVSATGLPHDAAEVRSRIQEVMRTLLHLPDRVMSYFQHPSTQYATAMNG
ncbi:Mobile element protein [Fimbriiglobus ruber]|uniref:Mobile element protein n=1 Tax=Fimbriiglobus ruber TaxID=1908690 RepID=A0A225DKT7_9BACT|nr:transposase [Fimbriiglobus ruber]OWK39198.1 Mobile element protein [Fimbriiglobus ruber]